MRARGESGLMHPIALAAIATLVINDHVLKVHAPSALTGKLSDVAGLVFFPLLLAALLAIVVRGVARERLVIASVIATGVVFALVKTWAPATAAVEHAMGFLQRPYDPVPVAIVRDFTDLVALPALWVAYRLRPTPPTTRALVEIPA